MFHLHGIHRAGVSQPPLFPTTDAPPQTSQTEPEAQLAASARGVGFGISGREVDAKNTELLLPLNALHRPRGGPLDIGQRYEQVPQ